MTVKLGLNAKLYYYVMATRYPNYPLATAEVPPVSGTLTNYAENGNVMDLTLNLSKAEADVTTRAADGWRQSIGTIKDGEVSFDMIYDTTDAAFNDIQKAWDSSLPIAMAVLDNDKAGVYQGLHADFTVITFEKQEALEDGQKVSVTLKPTDSAMAPAWITGSP